MLQYGDLAGPLDTDATSQGVALAGEPFTFDPVQVTSPANRSRTRPGVCHTLAKDSARAATIGGGDMRVRRLTCLEMERLQGFPEGYTLIPRDKVQHLEPDMVIYYRRQRPHATDDELHHLAADGVRAKALGNSMAVSCMRFIGSRILLVDGVTKWPDWNVDGPPQRKPS